MRDMSSVSTDANTIKRFLTRGVENVYPNRDAVEKALRSGKRLRVYLGIDPTGPTLHLGHIIPLRKLAEMQKLGHEVILLIGDFTAMIGDPTDKAATRKPLMRNEVMANCKNYKKQASHFLSFGGSNGAQLKYNSTWLKKFSYEDVIELNAKVTVQQMEKRDMFEKRLTEGKAISMHELQYPLMQGYDSVAMSVDMEVGGNDQTFNMLMGRDLVRSYQNREKFVLATSLLADATGVKMGKTEGNMVAMTDSPEDMYGKVMSWTDGMIVPGFELCTDVSEEDIKSMEKAIKKGENPMPFKRQLAKEIVRMMAGDKEADAAETHFSRVHQAHEAPEDMPTFEVGGGMSTTHALVASGLAKSHSDARRQIEQGGVKVDGETVRAVNTTVRAGSVVQKGKRHFVKLV